MSRRQLAIGASVHFPAMRGGPDVFASEYRIEQLLACEDGATLYKIKTDAEPFDRVVGEQDLTQRS